MANCGKETPLCLAIEVWIVRQVCNHFQLFLSLLSDLLLIASLKRPRSRDIREASVPKPCYNAHHGRTCERYLTETLFGLHVSQLSHPLVPLPRRSAWLRLGISSLRRLTSCWACISLCPSTAMCQLFGKSST
jgi:hypothetical protein